MQERSPREVEREFGLKDRALESLRDRASGFAGMVAAFCQRMKFTQLELLIAKFQVALPGSALNFVDRHLLFQGTVNKDVPV